MAESISKVAFTSCVQQPRLSSSKTHVFLGSCGVTANPLGLCRPSGRGAESGRALPVCCEKGPERFEPWLSVADGPSEQEPLPKKQENKNMQKKTQRSTKSNLKPCGPKSKMDPGTFRFRRQMRRARRTIFGSCAQSGGSAKSAATRPKMWDLCANVFFGRIWNMKSLYTRGATYIILYHPFISISYWCDSDSCLGFVVSVEPIQSHRSRLPQPAAAAEH